MSFILCMALRLLAAFFFFFFFFFFFVFCPVCYLVIVLSVCDHLVWGKGAGCFAFHWLVAYVLSVLAYLLCLLVPLVGCGF